MKTHNAKNERVKHAYLTFRKGAGGHSDASLEATAKALSRFDAFNRYRDFSQFRSEQATSFKTHLLESPSPRTDQPLSLSTIHSTLGALRGFFFWLSQQRGYRSKLNYSDSEYFRLTRKDARIATARRMPEFPTEAHLIQAVTAMPTENEIDRRNQAAFAFICLTGMRNSAVASVQIGDIDLESEFVTQDARHVRTKYSKTMVTGYFPVDARFGEIVAGWVRWLREEKGYEGCDPAFPTTAKCGSSWCSPDLHLARSPWKSSGPLRKIFCEAFERVGLKYFNPHSVRHTIEFMREERALTDAERKAWSQNLGHEHVKTSMDSYAPMDQTRQLAIMKALRTRNPTADTREEMLKTLLDVLQDPKLKAAISPRKNSDTSDEPRPSGSAEN